MLLDNPNVPFSSGEDSSSLTRDIRRSREAALVLLPLVADFGQFLQPNSLTLRSRTGGIGSLPLCRAIRSVAQPTFPWAVLAGALVVGSLLVWFVGGAASVSQVSDGQGHNLIANGQWNQDANTMLSGVRRIPNLGGLGKGLPPAFLSNRSGALLHTVTGKANGNYSLYLVGNGGGAISKMFRQRRERMT